jgi:hypothetical protein
MARKKPYTKGLAIIDIFLSAITGFGWMIIVVPRELYMHSNP